jgi:hypothetical protein
MAYAVAERRGDAVEPRPAIVVGQRLPMAHLGARLLGMQIVAVDELAAKRLGEPQPDRRLAGAGDAHDDDRERLRRVRGRRSGSTRHGPPAALDGPRRPPRIKEQQSRAA